MKPSSWFVTGTDTGVGKTFASVLLLRAFRAVSRNAYGMKPVASGCKRSTSGLVSDDALKLMASSSSMLPYTEVNPVSLEAPCSPNIAALLEGRVIDPDYVMQSCRQMQERDAIIIIEGVGGWRTPVFGLAGMDIIVTQLQLPVILVVGLRLGCINHALLTLEAIRNDGIELAGWIVNQPDPGYFGGEQTVSCLRKFIGYDPLGIVPYHNPEQAEEVHSCIDIGRLLNRQMAMK